METLQENLAAHPAQLPQDDLTCVRARLAEADVQYVVRACGLYKDEGAELYQICLEYQTQMRQLSNGVRLPISAEQVQHEHDAKGSRLNERSSPVPASRNGGF